MRFTTAHKRVAAMPPAQRCASPCPLWSMDTCTYPHKAISRYTDCYREDLAQLDLAIGLHVLQIDDADLVGVLVGDVSGVAVRRERDGGRARGQLESARDLVLLEVNFGKSQSAGGVGAAGGWVAAGRPPRGRGRGVGGNGFGPGV